MMSEIHFEGWAILLFLAFLFIPPILSCVGIYYLFSKKFSNIALVTSAIIFFSFVIFVILSSRAEPFLLNLSGLGFPFSFLNAFFPPNVSSDIFFGLIGLALNYFAVFSVVNFIHRKFVRKYS